MTPATPAEKDFASGDLMSGPLSGLRVLDLTRVLAGPGATQALGDMGAEVIKIEKPNAGDDTRAWGPPYLKDAAGNDTSESAYYLCANRNKKSVALDFTKPEGLVLLLRLLEGCDVLVENFKPGSLEKHGLSYTQLREKFPRLIYCSLTGFGHAGPYHHRPGYDYMIQAMGGIMSLTGEADGEPHKMAIAYADVMTGLQAINGILAALYAREKTGKGQMIDIALLDTQVAGLWNIGLNYLTNGQPPKRMGNAHASIVPYQVFECTDGHVVLAVGNDRQFADFCVFAKLGQLVEDPRFKHNDDRVRHRDELVPLIRNVMAQHAKQYWVEGLEKINVPCGAVNTLPEVFADPQVIARGMVTEMTHPLSAKPVKLLANPLKFSDTPVTYRLPPPVLGQHTQDVLKNMLGLNDIDINALSQKGVI